MKFKPKTRGGYEYRIYATDGSKEYPIHGAVYLNGLGWQLQKWTHNGQHSYDVRASLDLIPDAPEPFEFDCMVDVGSQNYRAPKECARFGGHKVRVRIEVVE